MRNSILYIACSIDGFIAKPDGDISFLDSMQVEGEDYGYATFSESVDTIIMGRKTYDKVVEMVGHFPTGGKQVYIMTRQQREDLPDVKFTGIPVADLVRRLQKEDGKHLFIDGGAEIVNALLRADLIDEMYLSIIPICLGDGVRLFASGRPSQLFELQTAKSYPTGLVQLHYLRRNNSDKRN